MDGLELRPFCAVEQSNDIKKTGSNHGFRGLGIIGSRFVNNQRLTAKTHGPIVRNHDTIPSDWGHEKRSANRRS